MNIFRSMIGMVYVEIVSADVAGLLTLVSSNNIRIDHLYAIDEMTVRGTIYRLDYKKIKSITLRRGDKLTYIESRGIYWRGKRLATRPVLLTGLIFILALTLFLPSRILFIQVQGNCNIPSKMILEAAEKCGISMFASRREVRSEKIKNALLERIPDLQWVGVNTAGCVATICVSEKTTVNKADELEGKVSSVIATRDGIIRECIVRQGNAVCQVGQVVRAGQTLVSGYIDCGIKIKGTRADAEIFAQTLHDLQMVSPLVHQKRGLERCKKKKYSILIGKKLIKLYNDSGISDTTCVKIYDEIKLTLPGGYQLPISFIRESITDYHFCAADTINENEWLQDAAIRYLQSHMIAGQILNQHTEIELEDNVYYLSGQFSCLEMIGQTRIEENLLR